MDTLRLDDLPLPRRGRRKSVTPWLLVLAFTSCNARSASETAPAPTSTINAPHTATLH